MNENAKSALQLLKKENTGILSTHSLDIPGYPFGSVTPYALDESFSPIILVSGIAQHTKNMQQNPKVSLTIAEASTESEKQALGRYTYIADAQKIENDSDDHKTVSEIYLRYFPAAVHYFEAHDFQFYRLNLVKGRYIEGFGKIFWIEKEDTLEKSIFTEYAELKIINHMNEDHLAALKNYCSFYKKISLTDEMNIKMVGIYQYGFDLLLDKEKLHFKFDLEITDENSARERLVQMAKDARQ